MLFKSCAPRYDQISIGFPLISYHIVYADTKTTETHTETERSRGKTGTRKKDEDDEVTQDEGEGQPQPRHISGQDASPTGSSSDWSQALAEAAHHSKDLGFLLKYNNLLFICSLKQ